MIVDYGATPNPGFEKYLDDLAKTAQFEETTSGLEYLVSEQLPIHSAVVGTVQRSNDAIDVELFVSSEVKPEVRKWLADVCFRSQESADEFAVARACNDVLPTLEGEDAVSFIHTVGVNLDAHRRGFAARYHKGEYPHPLTRAQLRTATGWVALRKPINEQGQEALAKLEALGLTIPMFEEGHLSAKSLRPKTRGRIVEARGMMEHSQRHHCACCSGQIPKGTIRITTSLPEVKQGYDHHHMHPTCFFEKELPHLDLSSARIITTTEI